MLAQKNLIIIFQQSKIVVLNKLLQKGMKTMKKDIHPEYKKMKIKCVCGNEIETGSIEENITVEICNKCHPFYTGNQKIMDTEGRVERFKKRYENK